MSNVHIENKRKRDANKMLKGTFCVLSLSLFIMRPVFSASVVVDTFEWVSVGDNVGKITVIKAHVQEANGGGPCMGSRDWEGSGYKCRITAGSFSSAGATGIEVFNSNRSIASDSAQVVLSLNNLIGRTFPVAPSNTACVLQEYRSPTGSGFAGIPTSCSGGYKPPSPSPVTCSLSSMILDHGNISQNKVNGAKKTGAITLKCSDSVTVQLTIRDKIGNTNTVPLRDDKSTSSVLTVNDKDISSSALDVNVEKDLPKKIIVQSSLTSSGVPDAGVFIGSGIAVITIP